MNRYVGSPRRYLGPTLMIGGGLATIGALIFAATKKSAQTVETIEKAVTGTDPPASLPPEPGHGGLVQLRLTGYWPFTAKAEEQKMEGGVHGAAVWNGKKAIDPATGKRPYLVTVEQHRSDPAKYPYVSLSGDDALWPLGQKVMIPWSDGRQIVGRVVDTGGNFRGAKKVYRLIGHEPIDVCVHSSKTRVPEKVVAQIIPGDNWEAGRAVASGGFRGQTVVTGDTRTRIDGEAAVEARTTDDYEALARALESELSGRSDEELISAAWTMRNRAEAANASIHDMLAPFGQYGPTQLSGGYASTRREAKARSREIAEAVLDAPAALDPTDCAIEFWVPEQQCKMRQLGDVYRAAVASGDQATTSKYALYADYGTENDVRAQHARDGLHVVQVVGALELLRRTQ